jgi:hypothetical protein
MLNGHSLSSDTTFSHLYFYFGYMGFPFSVLMFLFRIKLVSGENGKYDCYIKRTTDNVLQILLQVYR